MEKPMRQIRFVVLIIFTVVGVTGGFGRAEFARAPTNVSVDSQEMRPAQASALSQSAMGNSLIMAQSMPKPDKPKDKPDKPKDKKSDQDVTQTSDRTDNYQCLEYCAVVRQSCEVLATIQPDPQIAKIGSKENNAWSRECQKIHNGCIDECNTDDSGVQWKRFKEHKDKNKR
jgi:hypothetical protein